MPAPEQFKTYQATYNSAGMLVSLQEIPAPEQSKTRTLLVRAKTAEKAEEVAKHLFSLAK